ncbi:MAG: flagellar hook-basal body complex protein FliE [Planctomycetota bacterium]
MVNGIGGGGGAGRAAIDAALQQMRARQRSMGAGPSEGGAPAEAPSFAEALKSGVAAVEGRVDRANELHLDVVSGKLDIHEVAAQIKESEITFQFALQVRNKLLDAYREVMRMSV